MAIKELRLLEGIAQALQTIDANTDDPYAKSIISAASIATDELRNRQDTEGFAAYYAQGRKLLENLTSQLSENDQKAVSALPETIDANETWASMFQHLTAMLEVTEQLALQQKPGTETPEVAAALNDLFGWEAEGHLFSRPPTAEPVSAAQSPDAVAAFIRSQGGDYADAKVVDFSPLAGGFSKQTILFAIETTANGVESFVLRGYGQVKVIGLRGQEIPAEFHLLRYAFAGGVLCAEPMWLNDEIELQYFISRRLPGKNIGDGINEIKVPDSVAKSLAEAVAKIHSLPIDQSHPDIQKSHLAADATPTRYEAQKRFIEEWIAAWNRSNVKSPIAARAFKWILDNVPKESDEATLVHCDAGFNNLLVEDGEVSAVLDWEISHLGDPAEDLAWLLYQIKDPEMQQRFLKYYKDAGGIAQVDPFRLKYYDVVASMKSIISMVDIGECFQRTPGASVHLCSYALPYLEGPLSAIVKQVDEAGKLQKN